MIVIDLLEKNKGSKAPIYSIWWSFYWKHYVAPDLVDIDMDQEKLTRALTDDPGVRVHMVKDGPKEEWVAKVIFDNEEAMVRFALKYS